MAISVAHPYYYNDLSSLSDPLRLMQSFDYSIEEQMDFRNSSIADENITRTIYGTSTSDLQLLVDPTIDFVDTQSSTKETWSTDFNKPQEMLGSQVIGVENIQTVPRKRRMEWETLELSSTNAPTTGPKITSVASIKDRRKIARIGWTDDIDFDLNGDLNNGYLNNEAFLSLSSALNILKHEIPSPSSEQPKPPKSPQEISGQAVNHQPQQVGNVVSNTTVNDAGSTILQKSKNQPEIDAPSNPNLACTMNVDVSSCGKVENSAEDKSKFQYVLAAPTSIATKNNEDTLTYLNQGQSYEIKLKKLGDLSTYRGKMLKSFIKICFHERRLQYMEKEQMRQWQASRPGERIIEIDVPLSYGLCHVAQPNNLTVLNTVEVVWDPMKEVGVYIQVNCISTEFTPKKHGGEKGVPFRIQVETYLDSNFDTQNRPIHAAACQIKVFKLKGADRKHKQDREKIQKRTRAEQEKYQPSFECTILSDIPNDSITPPICYSPEHVVSAAPATGNSNKPMNVSPLMPRSPVQMTKYETKNAFTTTPHPIGINSVSSSNSNVKGIDSNTLSPRQTDSEDFAPHISKDASPQVLAQWMTYHRLSQHTSTFTHYSGADLLRMSKEDIIQICGIPDGIRMYNTLHSKAIIPKLTIYVSFDGSSYHALYLHESSIMELSQKLYKLPGFFEHTTNNGGNNVFSGWGLQSKYSGSGSNIYDASKLSVYIDGPAGIHVLVSDEVLNNIKDESLFALEFQNGKVIMKAVYKNENN